MSENLNRSNPDFSKYDSMSIGELEEILRADAMGPERDDSDVDEILYVMEVLAKKRRQNGIAGKTALEAYQEFQQHYLPMDKEEPKRKSNVIPFRRIAAVAASLVLVFSLTTTANAFSFRDVWDAVVTWAQETFCFSMGVEVSEPKAEDTLEYEDVFDALREVDMDVAIPTWIPPEYQLTEIITDTTPMQEILVAIYVNDSDMFKISVKSFLSGEPDQLEVSNNQTEVFTFGGNTYYIMQNNDTTRAAWIVENYECFIAGDLSVADIKAMVQSIVKG